MQGPGFYQISGIAFSGNGRISKVEVSADGGKSWAEAALQEPVLSKAFTLSAARPAVDAVALAPRVLADGYALRRILICVVLRLFNCPSFDD